MLTRLLALIFTLGACSVATPVPVMAAFETRATAAYVYDTSTDTIIFEKNADMPLPPASMSKLMTLNMLFEALRDGRVSLDTQFPVSTRARQMGGSTMFLDETDRPTVESLIKGIIVQSGNDACVVVAEGLAGSEDAFARLMNDRAPEIGLTGSTFVNATGWPAPNHRMTMRDLGTLATRLIEEFPEYYAYFALEEYDFDGRSPANRFNRNPILGLGVGGDGLKTGHTQEAGYGLVGSALQGNRRIVFVITGLDSAVARTEEAERVISWAFRQFVERDVVSAGTVVGQAPVWMGDHTRIDLVAKDDVRLLMPATKPEITGAQVEYRGPIEAPIEEGQPVAELVITREDLPDARIDLVADRDVVRGGFLPRVRSAAEVLTRTIIGEAMAIR
ncbi:MAG: D-alanyl-D-alanine carboxypeptidase family protein [Pseudomonadota bacterium]